MLKLDYNEIIAVIFSYISVIYAIRKSIWNWIWGVIGIVFYGIIFYQNKLYSNFSLQFIYLAQTVYGLIVWINNKKQIGTEVKVTKINNTNRNILFTILYFCISTVILYKIFDKSNSVFIDAATTSISIFATYLLTIGKIENWIYWMIANFLYLFLFINQGLYLSLILYLILLLLSVNGYYKWKNNE